MCGSFPLNSMRINSNPFPSQTDSRLTSLTSLTSMRNEKAKEFNIVVMEVDRGHFSGLNHLH